MQEWDSYESSCTFITEVIEHANRVLNSRLRLSNLTSINNELAASERLQTKLVEAARELSALETKCPKLLSRMSENGRLNTEQNLQNMEEEMGRVRCT